jgi:hypothetical protein
VDTRRRTYPAGGGGVGGKGDGVAGIAVVGGRAALGGDDTHGLPASALARALLTSNKDR